MHVEAAICEYIVPVGINYSKSSWKLKRDKHLTIGLESLRFPTDPVEIAFAQRCGKFKSYKNVNSFLNKFVNTADLLLLLSLKVAYFYIC